MCQFTVDTHERYVCVEGLTVIDILDKFLNVIACRLGKHKWEVFRTCKDCGASWEHCRYCGEERPKDVRYGKCKCVVCGSATFHSPSRADTCRCTVCGMAVFHEFIDDHGKVVKEPPVDTEGVCRFCGRQEVVERYEEPMTPEEEANNRAAALSHARGAEWG